VTRYELILSTGTETSEDEISAIKEAFSDGFVLSIDKNVVRLSEDLLPLLVSFTISIVSGVLSKTVYDLLKAAIMKLLHDPRVERDIVVEITHKQKGIIVTRGYIGIQSQSEEIRYRSIDDLFEDLKERP